MAGDDEVRARATLVNMQARIARGPYDALGLAVSGVSPQLVHTAFLTLTKQFHPARFARWSPDVLRMANEVFLGIKSAHDQLMRALGVPTRNVSGQSGSMAAVTATSSGPIRRPSGVHAAARPSGTQPPPRAPAAPADAIPRATGSDSMPAQRPTAPMASVTPAAPRSMPATGSAPISRTTTRQTTPPPPPAQDYSVPTARYAGTPPPTQPLPWDERDALQDALDLLGARDWSAAKVALHGLATRVPKSRYRALLSYARGRELQAAGKGDDAATEFERALQMDPTLGQAKIALADLKRK